MLTLEHAVVRIRDVTVLRGVDLRLSRGELVALVGPNGGGKSTLLRVLAGLLPVSGGRLVRHHAAGAGTSPRCALVGHETALGEALTLRENLGLIARLLDRDDRAAIRALERVGLGAAADRPLQACSQGMARRAELGRVLLTAPELLLLDEAHTALDADARSLVVEIARSVTGNGGCAVVVTHDLDDLTSWADRVLRVSDGRLEEVR